VTPVKALTKADLIEFYKQFIDPRSLSRAKLSVYLIAGAKTGENEHGLHKDAMPPSSNGTRPVLIEDVRAFKSSLLASAGPPVIDLTSYEELDAKR
jgi:hypothetical protein